MTFESKQNKPYDMKNLSNGEVRKTMLYTMKVIAILDFTVHMTISSCGIIDQLLYLNAADIDPTAVTLFFSHLLLFSLNK